MRRVAPATAGASAAARRRARRRRAWAALGTALILAWILPSVAAAWLAIHPRPLERWVRFEPTQPSDHGARQEPFQAVTADGVILRGWWIPTDAPVAMGTIVGLPGIASPKTDWSSFAAVVGPRGWDLVLYDGRGTGESDDGQCTWGLQEARDLGAVLDALQEQGRPAAPVVLVGTSMGAVTALRAAADDSRVKAVVAQSPFVSVRAAWRDLFHGPLGALGWVHRRTTWAFVGLLSREPSARDASLLDVMPRLRVPLLLVQGTEDPVVSPAGASLLLASAGSARKELVLVDGGRHVSLWHGSGNGDYRALLLAFLDSVSAPPAATSELRTTMPAPTIAGTSTVSPGEGSGRE